MRYCLAPSDVRGIVPLVFWIERTAGVPKEMHFRHPRPGHSIWGLSCLLAMLACGGGGRYIVVGTAKAPSTSGIIEVDELDGGSRLVTIHMEHLHPPDRLEEAYDRYVVWFEEPNSGKALRAGELTYNPDNRTGDLSETSPMPAFTIKITAEKKDNSGDSPHGLLVASQRISAE